MSTRLAPRFSTVCERAVRAPCDCGCAGHLSCPCHGRWIRSAHRCVVCGICLRLDETRVRPDGEIVNSSCFHPKEG